MRSHAFFLVLASILALAACDGGGGGGGGGSGGAGGSPTGSGGGGGSGGGTGGQGGAGSCLQPIPDGAFNQACAAPADCVLKFDIIDCCGSLAAIGINQADSAAFDMVEGQCQAPCDCAAQPTIADDGNTSTDASAFQVDCVGGVCVTSVTMP